MAIEKKLIHFSKLSNFETQLNAGNILDYSIVFIQDAKKIWTHGQYYDCNGGDGTSDSPTFLRIGDADDEAKANFIAVANGEKSADYYICSSRVQGVPVDGIITSLKLDGPTSSPIYVSYTFYGSPMQGGVANKLLKITTTLTISTGVITTTYEAVLDAKQDTITDLENIREGASKGATSVQPNDIPVYITDFDVLSLIGLARNSNVVDFIQFSIVELANALEANKMVLVPYSIDDNSVRGYATLVGYTEDFLYFKVITDDYEIDVATTLDTPEILGQEVTLRSWEDKQDELISGTNIKTINGNSILGSGNIEVAPIETLEDRKYVNVVGITDNALIYALPTSANGDEDDVIATRGTLKTINGQTLVGSGDITISGGGSSSGGSGAYSEISHGTNDTTFTLTPNTFHVWDEVSSLTLTLGAETSGVANEFLFQFTSGATATSLTLPDDIKWANDTPPTIAENMIYQVSILKGLASVLEFKNAVLISFTINGVPYQAEEGMNWLNFCDSSYNDGRVSVRNSTVVLDGYYPLYNPNGDIVLTNDIIKGINYLAQSGSGGGGA